MTVLDIILLVIMLIGLLLGFKRGFFGSITKPLKLVASACLTIVISSPIINAWTRPFFVGKIDSWIYKSLVEACPDSTGEVSAEAVSSVLKFLAEIFKLDMSSVGSEATTEEVLSVISKEMATPVGNLIAVVVTYLVLFIVFMLVLSLLIKLLDAVFTTGILGKINKFLGLLLGAVISMVIACIVANIVGVFSQDAVSGAITQFFKNINPFAIVMKL
ncbi:MAG: CvpA family protein [Clostridia bacterium]|nr:CvpA family protein [Clostridia bacterium]